MYDHSHFRYARDGASAKGSWSSGTRLMNKGLGLQDTQKKTNPQPSNAPAREFHGSSESTWSLGLETAAGFWDRPRGSCGAPVMARDSVRFMPADSAEQRAFRMSTSARGPKGDASDAECATSSSTLQQCRAYIRNRALVVYPNFQVSSINRVI